MIRRWPYAALVAFVGVIHGRVLFLGNAFIQRDSIDFTLPAREFLGASIARGRFPEWWDGVGFGLPFAGTPTYGTLQPLAWLVTPIGTAGADLYALVNLLIAGIGTALFAAELGASQLGTFVAGSTLMASGYAASTLFNNLSPVFAWTPSVAWAAARWVRSGAGERTGDPGRKRAWVLLAACVALQMWPGEPGGIVTAGLLGGVVVLARSGKPWRDLAGLALAFGSALLLAAAPLLPAAMLLQSSERAGGLDVALGGTWSLHPSRLLELAWPDALGRASEAGHWLGSALADTSNGLSGLAPSWSLSVFVGAPVLLLAGLAAARHRPDLRLLAFSAGFVVLALGVTTPVYGAFRTVFVPEQLVRYPEKHVIGALVIWAALAGVGLGRMVERAPSRAAVGLASGVAAVQVLLLAALAWMRADVVAALARVIGRGPAIDVGAALRISTTGAFAAAIVGCLFAAAAAFARGNDRERKAAAWSVGALVIVPLAWHAASFTVLARRSTVSEFPAMLAPVREEPASSIRPRVLRGLSGQSIVAFSGDDLARKWEATASGNTASRFGFDVLPGVQAESTASVVRFWTLVMDQRRDVVDVASLVGARWILGADSEIRGMPLPRAARSEEMGWSLFENPRARPRAFVATSWSRVPSEAAAVASLAAAGRASHLSIVVLDGPGPVPQDGPANAAATPCDASSERPERVDLLCEAPRAGYAVLLDAFAPGWTAAVDGVPARIERADGIFRAVAIGPGRHQVSFRYRTPGLVAGLAISLAAWAALALLLVRAGTARGTPSEPKSPARS